MSVRMRHTRSHTNNRRSHHALKDSTIVKDKNSGKLRLPHRLDAETGMYRGKQIVSKEAIARRAAKAQKVAKEKREHEHPEGHREPVHAEKEAPKKEGVLGRLTKGGKAKARSGFGGGA